MTGGQQYLFAKRLDNIYGEGTADKILRMSNEHNEVFIRRITRNDSALQ